MSFVPDIEVWDPLVLITNGCSALSLQLGRDAISLQRLSGVMHPICTLACSESCPEGGGGAFVSCIGVSSIVVVVKRLSRVITEVTYLEFLVLRFYLIYYHNDSHSKRDDYVRDRVSFRRGRTSASISIHSKKKRQCSSPGEALTWATPTLSASDRYRTMPWSHASPAHSGGVCPTVPGRDEYFLD